jgi:hypothetical protein
MATGKQLKAAMRVRRTAKGSRKKRTRPEPRQYTVVDLERARDRVAAAERRIENDRSGNPNRGKRREILHCNPYRLGTRERDHVRRYPCG